MIDWKKIASKPVDQARLARLFREAGLPLDPSCGFLNGIPKFTSPVDEAKIQEIIDGKPPKKKGRKHK